MAEISEQVDLCSIVDSHNAPDGDKDGIKKWIRDSKGKRIEILLTGRTGTGKSTLVNGLVGGIVAEEGHGLRPQTMSVTKYPMKTIDGVEIVVWDSPGLQDGTANEKGYLAEMKAKCSNVDIVIYCIKPETRSQLKDMQRDFLAIGKLTNTFGSGWWKHAIFVITYANMLETMLKTKHREQPLVEKEFHAAITSWKGRIHEALSSVGVPKDVVCKVPVEPAGHTHKPHLPGREYWLSVLWFVFVERAKRQSQSNLIAINKKRFKHSKDTAPEDFTSQPGHQQPIVMDDGMVKKMAAAGIITGIGVALNGMAIGAGVGAAVGAAGVGIGAAVGVVVGGAAGAAAGMLFYLWHKHETRQS